MPEPLVYARDCSKDSEDDSICYQCVVIDNRMIHYTKYLATLGCCYIIFFFDMILVKERRANESVFDKL